MTIFRIDKPDRRKVLLVRIIGKTPTVVSRQFIKNDSQTVIFKNKVYVIDFDKPSYRVKNIFCYLVDIDQGQLHYEKTAKMIVPQLVHLILKRSIVKQLVTNLEKQPFAQSLILLILGIALGLAGGYILGNVLPLAPPVLETNPLPP